ncbi:MAG TPA: metallophosphoesterase family protein [Solirubrobacteraceae bacterium]|jgi:predicted phosphodiesterase|nr:metallophosphoesterase family protein [Solirubrobacteraceae bacterium]
MALPAHRCVVALYDIHGNLPALDAVLAELRAGPPDAMVVGGDVCAGPMPAEVLARLRELPWPVHWLRGNADRAVVMGFDGTIPADLLDHPLYAGDAWAAGRLLRADRDFLAQLPPLAALAVAGLGDILFCHGTTRSDEERVTVVTPEERLAEILNASRASLLVGGHTHRQFDRSAGGRRMVNAGSVGRPYEHRPGAYWLRLGPDVQLRRTPYDVAGPDAAFRALGYPAADLVFSTEDPDAVAAGFERSRDRPPAPESLIAAADNPLNGRTASRQPSGKNYR